MRDDRVSSGGAARLAKGLGVSLDQQFRMSVDGPAATLFEIMAAADSDISFAQRVRLHLGYEGEA